MEISPQPQRNLWSAPTWVLLGLLVFAPVTLLAAVPAVFGLERYVMTTHDMSGQSQYGSVVFARRVPVSDLRVGDVVTYRPPASADRDGLVTRRVAELEPGEIVTSTDRAGERDPWRVDTRETPTVSRVVVGVPYAGYPLLQSVGASGWLVVLLGAGAALGGLALRDARR